MAKKLTSQEDSVREWLLNQLNQDNLDFASAQSVVSMYVSLSDSQFRRENPPQKGAGK